MKQIDEYITEKLHLNKDANKKTQYVLIYDYAFGRDKWEKCEYEIFDTEKEVIKVLQKPSLWHDVYKVKNIHNIEEIILSFYDFRREKERDEYLRKLGVENCKQEILDHYHDYD